jgi:hypothetical protein
LIFWAGQPGASWLASLALLGISMMQYFDLLRCSAWSLSASRALLIIIVMPYFDIL